MPISKSKNKPILITLGDPSGIGPEITAKALKKSSINQLAEYIIIGHQKIFNQYIKKLPPRCTFIDTSEAAAPKKIGILNSLAGDASYQYLKKAVELIKNGTSNTLVTAPVCKEAIKKHFPEFEGHTEFFANAFHIKTVGMMFVSPKLKTIIVTRHLPIAQVHKMLTKKIIMDTVHLSQKALKKIFKIKEPRIAICGLNPHAGEGGSIGHEEIQTIIPAIKKLKAKSIRVSGPFAADTLFLKSTHAKYDLIVAMYHDQGLIPIKTLYFDQLVNLTIGLPFVRTSPAHGTAFDIAGKNLACANSMCAAIKEAVSLSS